MSFSVGRASSKDLPLPINNSPSPFSYMPCGVQVFISLRALGWTTPPPPPPSPLNLPTKESGWSDSSEEDALLSAEGVRLCWLFTASPPLNRIIILLRKYVCTQFSQCTVYMSVKLYISLVHTNCIFLAVKDDSPEFVERNMHSPV